MRKSESVRSSTGRRAGFGTPFAHATAEQKILSGQVTAEVQIPRCGACRTSVGLAVALPVGVALALSAQGAVARAAAIAFASSVVGMFGVSTLFHRIAWESHAKLWLGRIDHTMIYALIAGTYTPITLLVLRPGWRAPILAIVWGGALVATVAKFVWHGAPRWVAPATSWSRRRRNERAPTDLRPDRNRGRALLVGGGAFYTIGAVVYATRRPDPRPATFGYHRSSTDGLPPWPASTRPSPSTCCPGHDRRRCVGRGRRRLKLSVGVAFCVLLVALSLLVGDASREPPGRCKTPTSASSPRLQRRISPAASSARWVAAALHRRATRPQPLPGRLAAPQYSARCVPAVRHALSRKSSASGMTTSSLSTFEKS